MRIGFAITRFSLVPTASTPLSSRVFSCSQRCGGGFLFSPVPAVSRLSTYPDRPSIPLPKDRVHPNTAGISFYGKGKAMIRIKRGNAILGPGRSLGQQAENPTAGDVNLTVIPREKKPYNATIRSYDREGKPYGVFVGEVEDGVILRSNFLQFTGLEGTPYYHRLIEEDHRRFGRTFEIVLDGCRGYKRGLRALALPPAYY